MKKRIFGLSWFLILGGLCLQAQQAPQTPNQMPQWTVVYQNDANGKPLFGDIQQLIRAVRAGIPVRLAWAAKRPDSQYSVEHVIDANFLTVMSGKVVQAQINRIYGQRPIYDKEITRFRDKPLNYWTAIFSTNGKTAMLNYNIDSGKLVDQIERPMGVIWYALMPAHPLPEINPLWQPRRK